MLGCLYYQGVFITGVSCLYYWGVFIGVSLCLYYWGVFITGVSLLPGVSSLVTLSCSQEERGDQREP